MKYVLLNYTLEIAFTFVSCLSLSKLTKILLEAAFSDVATSPQNLRQGYEWETISNVMAVWEEHLDEADC